MKCEQFQTELLNLDASSRPDSNDSTSSLLRHAETCQNPVCQQSWEDSHLLNRAIHDWKLTPVASPLNVDSLTQNLLTQHSQLKTQSRRVLIARRACLILAPCVLIAVIALMFAPSQNPLSQEVAHSFPLQTENSTTLELAPDSAIGNESQPVKPATGSSDELLTQSELSAQNELNREQPDQRYAMAFLSWRDDVTREAVKQTTLNTNSAPDAKNASQTSEKSLNESELQEPLFRDFLTEQVKFIETQVQETLRSIGNGGAIGDSANLIAPQKRLTSALI